MKTLGKIVGITFATLVGLLLLAVTAVVYVIFTPNRLTPLVRDVADTYITCPHEVGDVQLTFFSTFPEFGLRLNGLYLINPMAGAQSDTLLAAPEVIARLDIVKLLRDNNLDISEVSLRRVQANIFVNESGATNLNVLALPETQPDTDTTSFSFPFEALRVTALELQADRLSFCSLRDSINACIEQARLAASADGWDDINLALDAQRSYARIGQTVYADSLSLALHAPHTAINLDSLRLQLRKAYVQADRFRLGIEGTAAMQDTTGILLDMHLAAEEWDIPQILPLLPENLTKIFDEIDINSALLSLNADIRGVYSDSLMPLVDATLTLDDADAAYMSVFPYRLQDLNTCLQTHLDLNDKSQSCASIERMHVRTGRSTLDMQGNITDLLGDPRFDITTQADVRLAEFRRYVTSQNKNNELQGRARANLNASIRLSDITAMRLAKGKIAGSIDFTDLFVRFDSLTADMPKGKTTLRIPNPQPARSAVAWLDAALDFTQLDLRMPAMNVTAADTRMHLQVSDILSNSNLLCTQLALQSEQPLSLSGDSINARLHAPDMTAYVEYDTAIENAIPTADATLRFAGFNGTFSDMRTQIKQSTLTAKLSGSRRDKSQPRAKLTLATQALSFDKGDSLHAETGQLLLTASAVRNPAKEQFLLQWNPRLSVQLEDGQARLVALAETVRIPAIDFEYSNRLCTIRRSEMQLGNSQFALTGEIRNIGRWLDHKDRLQGELNFTSDFTDVNQLMALFSADTGSDEQAPATATQNAPKPAADEANPFLVPTDVDVVLNTNIREAAVFDQLARNLAGRLYIKNGTLILEEMGFVCNAAKLQLTALYRTPRRDHIYVGLDYHMLDINIQELVNMIPQIDTMMPMLRSFRGSAEFHLACETYTRANYDIKPSTIRGACSIEGKDLVLLDSETFGKIAKLLLFNRKTENKVDSLSAQFTIYKDEIDIYPFCLTLDKYTAAVGGHHNLDMSFDYHISLLRPMHLGVDVKGTFDDLKIKLAKCRYAKDFQPAKHQDVETQNMSLKRAISNMLKASVKPIANENP